MNFGEIKTTVFAAIPLEKREKVSVFEFGEAIDDAQVLFATVLPEVVIPELVIEQFINPGDAIGSSDLFPLPEDYLKAEKIQFAQVRDDSDQPLRRDARLVPPADFDELKSAGSKEFIASVFNNLIYVNPEPAAAVDGEPSTLKIIYRKRPRPYTTTAGVLQQAARVTLQQNIDARHTFLAYDYGGVPSARKWDYWGLDVEELPGGYVYMGGSDMTDDTKNPLYIMHIVQAWDSVLNVAHLRVSSDDSVPVDDDPLDPGGTGFSFPYCYVAQRPVFGYSGSMVEAGDHEFPDIGANWHHLVCSYAIARLEEGYDKDAAKLRMGRVFQTLAAAGAKLDYSAD